MKKAEEKHLINVNKKGIFNKIKIFLMKLFRKSKKDLKEDLSKIDKNTKKESFVNSIKIEESEEKELLRLQEQYRKGKIKEEDLSKEQIDKLCDSYDRQIENLQKEINIIKQEILEYVKKMITA